MTRIFKRSNMKKYRRYKHRERTRKLARKMWRDTLNPKDKLLLARHIKKDGSLKRWI